MPNTSIEQHTAAIAAIEAFMGYAADDGMMVRLRNEEYFYNFEDFRLHYKGEPLPYGVAVRVLAQFASARLTELSHAIADLHHEGNYRWTAQLVHAYSDRLEPLEVTTDPQDYSSGLASLVLHTKVLRTLLDKILPPKNRG